MRSKFLGSLDVRKYFWDMDLCEDDSLRRFSKEQVGGVGEEGGSQAKFSFKGSAQLSLAREP